jgi:hypothetical protein
MRLLNVHSLKLQKYHEPRVRPKYAIASHRWVANEEATMQDVREEDNIRRDSDNGEKSGIIKVKEFANYVRENYAGVDRHMLYRQAQQPRTLRGNQLDVQVVSQR